LFAGKSRFLSGVRAAPEGKSMFALRSNDLNEFRQDNCFSNFSRPTFPEHGRAGRYPRHRAHDAMHGAHAAAATQCISSLP
jgi:hypothetical protein